MNGCDRTLGREVDERKLLAPHEAEALEQLLACNTRIFIKYAYFSRIFL